MAALRVTSIVVLLASTLGACTDEKLELLVDAKTDLRPGLAFTGIEVEVRLASSDDVLHRLESFAASSDDLLTGKRVAELDGLVPGSYLLVVTLVDSDGLDVAQRRLLVELRRDQAVTVLITTSCLRIDCPADGSDPALTECVAGRCVDPRCSPEEPAFCGEPDCTTSADCSAAAPCTEQVCVDAACFSRADDSLCEDELVCDPRVGCVAPRRLDDAGVPCAAAESECGDGVDEDCDALADCADSDCLGETCDDGDACSMGDRCGADGACTPEAAVSCDDTNACTDDTCDPTTGCRNTPNTADCDDGDLCTQGDRCAAGVCSGASVDCDDGNLCTDDACDPTLGCTAMNNTASCDDGSWCTGTDSCRDGACSEHTTPPCPTLCNEAMMACVACAVDADCGVVVLGPWGSCGGFSSTCDETGTRTRTVTTPTCDTGACTTDVSIETQACSRVTTGATCGTTTNVSWSSCGGYSDVCDETGTQSRSVTTRTCASGSCQPNTSTEARACSRSVPNGRSCGTGIYDVCCAGVCRTVTTNRRCGACNVDCAAEGLVCRDTGSGGYACRDCLPWSPGPCRSAYNSSATCNDTWTPPYSFCQCQCGPLGGVCAGGGCGGNFYCWDCPGRNNYCSPVSGRCR